MFCASYPGPRFALLGCQKSRAPCCQGVVEGLAGGIGTQCYSNPPTGRQTTPTKEGLMQRIRKAALCGLAFALSMLALEWLQRHVINS